MRPSVVIFRARQVLPTMGLMVLEPVKPVFDTVITIEPKERTAEELVEEICKKIFISTNTIVGSGPVALNILQTKTSIGGSGETARSILERWILEVASRYRGSYFTAPMIKSIL